MRIALITAPNPVAPDGVLSGQPAPGHCLAQAMARLGHRVTVYARSEDPDGPRTAILGRGLSVEHVLAGPERPLPADQAARHMPELACQLSARWRTRPPDVVHAFTWTCGLAALGAGRNAGVPVLQSFGSLGSAERRRAGRVDVSACRVKLESYLGRTASAVLAGSAEEADELTRLAIPRAAIRVVPAGIDTDLFSPAGTERTRNGRCRLIAFGQCGEALGLDTAIRALTKLPDAELVIVGGPDGEHLPRSGPFRELARLASTLRVRKRVRFAGQVTLADLPELLRSADVMVSASPYEPTGTPAIQAMACGVPVVVSDVGAHADAVIDGVTGLLVPPENAGALAHRLRLLLARPALLQAYGFAAADRARSRYSCDRIGRETVAAYQRCLDATSTLPPACDDDSAGTVQAADLSEVAAFG